VRANTTLYGPRIMLRDFRPGDTHDVFGYASDPIVTRHAGWRPHRTPYDSRLYIQRCLAESWSPITFAIEHRAEGRVIGVVDIRTVSRWWGVGEIGYTLARRYWGQGYNVEAGRLLVDYGFACLGLRRIRATCDVDNCRSYRTMEKLGMVREGVIHGTALGGSSPVDRFVYSLLRREWDRRGSMASVSGALRVEPQVAPRFGGRIVADRLGRPGYAAGIR
jgi:ribosomal-protein-alanine N-acetyltransferase